jgi:SAM (Sterile alpha motif) domain-containing protein
MWLRPPHRSGTDNVKSAGGAANAANYGVGMSEYAQRFADLSVLSHINDQDLKDIGVLLGHRRKTLARPSLKFRRP